MKTLFCLLAAIASTIFLTSGSCRAQQVDSAPPASLLQSGDLIWPKKPNAVVPYNSRPGASESSAETQWEKEKGEYLKILEGKPQLTDEEKKQYKLLRSMSYDQFVSYYLDDRAPEALQTYGSGAIYVGHVGIVDVVDGKPTIVEAMLGKGVQRVDYADWLAARPSEIFWVGRLKEADPSKRKLIAEKAAQYIGKPYNFWNFNLEDTSGFYCSKLAWLSIVQALGMAPDDNANPRRAIWYSPKQLMKSPYLQIIVNPGNYGGRQ